MTALKDKPGAEPEVLIEEARRRQRLRRLSLGGLAGALAAIGIVFAITSSSGGGSVSDPPPPVSNGGGGAAGTVSWRELTAPGGALPTGTDISDVVRYHGNLIATGSSDLPAHVTGCSVYCGTVVWVSKTGQRWRPVFATNQNDAGNALIATKQGLTLLSPGMQSLDGGNSKPPSSKNALREMLRHGTPTWMTAPASSTEGNMVFSIGEDDDGAPTPGSPNINSEPAWTSASGVHWPASFDYKTFKWRSVVKVGHNFAGITQTDSGTTVLWSTNDRTWSRAHISIPSSNVVELASGPHGAVVELVPSRYPYKAKPLQFWYSTNGSSWNRASVSGSAPRITDRRGTMPTLIAAEGGFLAFDRTNTGIWWSKTGQTWKRVHVLGAPNANLEPQAVSVDGDSLLVAEQGEHLRADNPTLGPMYQTGPVTFWKISLTGLGKGS